MEVEINEGDCTCNDVSTTCEQNEMHVLMRKLCVVPCVRNSLSQFLYVSLYVTLET